MNIGGIFFRTALFFSDIKMRYMLIAAVFLLFCTVKKGKRLKECLLITLAGDFVWFFLINVFNEDFYSLWAGAFCLIMTFRLFFMSAKKCFRSVLLVFAYACSVFYMFYVNLGKYLYKI